MGNRGRENAVKASTFAVTLISCTLIAAAQPPRDVPRAPAATVTLSGRVVADDTGDPLRNARVSLTAGAVDAPAVLSDSEGRFTLAASPGQHSIVASKSGYGRRELRIGAGSGPIVARLQRGAAISGRVLDPFGEPAIGARVTLETRNPSSSATTVVVTTNTDDLGEYRLASLATGTYVVAVTTVGQLTPTNMGGGGMAMIPETRKAFYPDAAAVADAEEFRVGPGDERPSIDFRVPPAPLQLSPMVAMREAEVAAGRALPLPVGTAIIRGRVASTDGRLVAYARIQLIASRDPLQSRMGRADESGLFEFRDLMPGRFQLTAAKTGYTFVPGDRTADNTREIVLPGLGPTIDLKDGETRERVELKMNRWGAVMGRIVDEYGDPVQGATVTAFQLRYESGRRRLVPAGASLRMTDDLGRYRAFNLAPGRYVLGASIGGVAAADLPGYGRSYFPGTANAAEAQFVTLGLSQELSGIDFALSRTTTARVAGRVITAAGEAGMPGSLTLRSSQRSGSVTSESVGARIGADGTFEFPNVPPGQYVIQANRGRLNPWTEGEFGAMPVIVNGADVTDLTLQTSIGSRVSGRFTFDTADRSKIPQVASVELSAIPIDLDVSPPNNYASANVRADWTFELAGINGPRRLQLLRAPQGWALKDVLVTGISVVDRPLPFGRKEQSLNDVEIVLTDRVSELMGTITDGRSNPVPGSSILMFSTDRDRWYAGSRFLRRGSATPEGRFTVTGLPFGTYYVVAVSRLPADGEEGWQDPEFLNGLMIGAATVTIAEGERQVLNLRVGR